jgi:hypothetical protein
MTVSHQTPLFASPDKAAPRSEDFRRLKVLAEEVLPEKAASGNYPVRFDHCFKRIAYDVAVGGQWDTDVTPPFYQNAPLTQVRRAVRVLREMGADSDRAFECNRRSLHDHGARR